jgi:hypothetical protein
MSEWLTSRPGKETLYPFYKRLDGPVQIAAKYMSLSPGLDLRTEEPIVSPHIDKNISAYDTMLTSTSVFK